VRRALVMWCLLALAACRSSGEPAPATKSEPAPPPASTAPAEPAAPTAPETSAPPVAATPPHATAPVRTTPGTPRTPQCRKDADCALTLVPDGDCCPRLCAPRAVTAEEVRRVNERVQRCERENRPCVMPNCRARPFEPACVDGTCSARAAAAD